MRIFIDMDEVIADTFNEHINWYNKEFDASLNYEACYGNEVMHVVPEEHQESIRKHCISRGFFRNLKPIEHSQEILKILNNKHELFIASAATQFPNSLEEKSDWLDEYFPFIPWQNRILCGHKHILKGDVLIDDRSYNLREFDGRKLLFTAPHNIHETQYERVNNWLEVAALLD